MAAPIDREIRKLLRRLSEWRRQERTARNRSVIEVGERAIKERLRTLSRQQKARTA